MGFQFSGERTKLERIEIAAWKEHKPEESWRNDNICVTLHCN